MLPWCLLGDLGQLEAEIALSPPASQIQEQTHEGLLLNEPWHELNMRRLRLQFCSAEGALKK